MSDDKAGASPAAAYLAIDWGTTNRRVYVMAADGSVLATARDDRGIKSVEAGCWADELAGIRARFGDLPAIAAGMVGSTRGWREIPYVIAPAGVTELATGIGRIPEERFFIVPGVAYDTPDHADVMRGEEVQAVGACLSGLAPHDALFCQPGTHNKWIGLKDARITSVTTALTGELFALLRDHSILAEMMTGPVEDGPAFRAGIADAAGGDLLSRLFGVRASVLLGRRAREDGAAYTSGLLIGADVAAREVAGRLVHILSDPNLGPLYAVAIEAFGGTSTAIDGQAAFVAGIHHIWSMIDD
ncbi:2-dehydro-3-deoxygalactonokinase [Sphingomonas sp. BIUV-7]|uniref:2-dehydro-3-deoxygalactonokinase n=1 Tax=Sphingomonas natans TaxID=3063330 RepID=A0ABT8YDC1_9SPHN|nr:2-dehydro-3-deoxygalactonokinase [Sphingomonas sp. BIUV-7]MDO6415783.1 2-dehydro-3-deoxygalactonokinase [Sphingomonas sp. BIUV-7]